MEITNTEVTAAVQRASFGNFRLRQIGRYNHDRSEIPVMVSYADNPEEVPGIVRITPGIEPTLEADFAALATLQNPVRRSAAENL